MKAIIVTLALIALGSAFSAATGIRRLSSSNNGEIIITHHNLAGRAVAGATCVLCAAAALGCAKRRKYGWWIVTVMLATVLIISVAWAIREIILFDLPLGGKIIGAIGELVKIAFWSWLLFVFWKRHKKTFWHEL